MHNNTHANPNRPLQVLSKPRHFLVLIALTGIVFVGSVSAQSTVAANTNPGTVLGRVLDSSKDPVANATVVLQKPDGDHATVVTMDDGSFAFHDLIPGIAYHITVTAQGYGDWSSSVTVEPGQEKTLTDVTLHILAVKRAVTVTYSSKQVAAQQLKAEEQQRVLGFIPNIFVTYEPHPEPLTAKMKFHLAYKSFTNPVFSVRAAAWAGVQQARDNPSEWGQGTDGYGKRLGAGFADAITKSLINNAILPSLLHQDPRYFYDGTETK